jgi:outer membrane protein assembly factor BamA
MKATDRLILPDLRRAGALVGLLLCGVVCLGQTSTAPPAGAGKMIVADVRIQGNHTVAAQQISALIKTRAGAEYNEETAQDDVRTLMATTQFKDVQVVTQDGGGGRVIVFFLVRDYPNLVQRVEYKGAKHPSDDDLNGLHSVRPNTPLNPIANKLACQAIVHKYNEEGRPFADCRLLKGDKPGDTEVIFQITEGPKVGVKSISFVGNSFVSGPVLATHINSWSGILGLGNTYNPLMVEQDVAKLEEYYKNFGYLDAKVKCERQWLPSGDEVNLIFHVHEGTRYIVQTTPHVFGVQHVAVEQVDQLIKVPAHEYFDKHKVEIDQKNITDYIEYTGHKARVEPDVVYSQDGPGLVRVNYQVKEEGVAKVGQIFIVGNTRTSMNVILRQVGLYPGQVLTYPDLRIAERNLARLGIFKMSPDGREHPTVTVVDNPNDPTSEYKDILVTVEEDNTGSLMFGLGVNSDAGFTGSVVLNERNFDITRLPGSFDDALSGNAFRGAGQEFRAEAVPGTQLQRYSISWREPFVFDSPYSLTVGGYYLQRLFNEYDENRLGARFGVGRRINDAWTANVGVRVENVDVNNVPFFAPVDYTSVRGNNFQVGIKAGATRDTRDSIIRPTEGSQLDLTAEEVLGDHTFTLANAEISKFFTIWQRADGSGRHVLVVHSQVAWASDNTPVYERYFAGGFRSMRGFEFRGVGPVVNGFKVGGDFMFLNSLEWQIPILANDKFYAVTFLDSGTVESHTSIRDYRVAAGFGFRFVVPMLGQVPIAVDFGFPIVRGPNDNTQLVSFWLGFSR